MKNVSNTGRVSTETRQGNNPDIHRFNRTGTFTGLTGLEVTKQTYGYVLTENNRQTEIK